MMLHGLLHALVWAAALALVAAIPIIIDDRLRRPSRRHP